MVFITTLNEKSATNSEYSSIDKYLAEITWNKYAKMLENSDAETTINERLNIKL